MLLGKPDATAKRDAKSGNRRSNYAAIDMLCERAIKRYASLVLGA